MGIRFWEPKIPAEVEACMDRLIKPVGSLGFDPWGYSEAETRKLLSRLYYLYKYYFRVNVIGLENIPKKGRLIVAANHAGQYIPADALMLYTALALNPRAPRLARGMMERIFPKTPFAGNFANRTGNVLGDTVNCRKMLEREETVMVFPEGERGAIKAWKYRYQLQRMGTGFIRMALENDAPLLPVGIVGVEEMSPGLGRFQAYGDLMGTPPLPIALPLMLPVRIHLVFGKPKRIRVKDYSEETMRKKVEEYRAEMNELITYGRLQRQGIFH